MTGNQPPAATGSGDDASANADSAEIMQRQTRIETALADVLEDGERWIVQGDNRGVRVLPADHDVAGRSLLRFTHPDVYGRLLALNERMRAAGGPVGFELGLVVALCGIAAVEAGWLAGAVSTSALDSLANGWVYALFAVLVFAATSVWRETAARRLFARERANLARTFDRIGLTREEAIVLLDGDESVRLVLQRLKRDAAAAGEGRHGL